MYRRIRRIIIYSVVIFAVFLCLIVSLSYIFRNKITSIILAELNKRLETEIVVKNIDFSVLRKFPYASIELKDIWAKSSRNYKPAISDGSTDTLFRFQSLFLEFRIYDLLKKNYRISKIHALNGKLNIARDRQGNFNYEIWKKADKSDSTKFEIKLQNVRFEGVQAVYKDFKNPLTISTNLENCQVRCKLSAELNDFQFKLNGKINLVQKDSLVYVSNRKINGSIGLHVGNNKLSFDPSDAILEDVNFHFDGYYNFRKKEDFRLKLACDNYNFERDLSLLPSGYIKALEKLQLKGDFSFTSDLYYTNEGKLELGLKFSQGKSPVDFEFNRIKLSSLDFQGEIIAHPSDTAGTTKISVNKLSGKIDGKAFTGAVFITKSDRINFDIKWQGKSAMTVLHKLIPSDTLKYFIGDFGGKLEISGRLKDYESMGKYEFAHFDYKGELQIENLKILKPEILLGITDISGKFRIDHDIEVENCSIIYKENQLSGTGKLINFLPWLLTSNETLKIQGELKSSSFSLDKVMAKTSNGKQDSSVTHFPDYLLLAIDVKFDEFYSGKFKAANVAGKISYKPKLFNLRSLYFETMEGNLTGSALVLQKPDDNFIFRTQTQLDKINITTLFSTFNDFGQTLIASKNIKGKVSGMVNLAAEWTNSFSIITRSILVDGNFKIEKGELIEYEPLNGLSKYINVDELKHIYFSTLQNDIFIRNRVITIPQMEIKSENFDIIGSGTHDFDNNFNYKTNVMLSEALYRKAKQSKADLDEIGVIETRSNRKISLPLTIRGNIDNYKVVPDAKQAAANMIQNLKKEKKQLRTILNEEFGIFKKDSVSTISKEEKKTPALIEFEEDKYQSGKKTVQPAKTTILKSKEKAKNSKDTTKIKIDFQ